MNIMPTRIVKAGDIIFQENDSPAEGLFFICYGTVQISRDEPKGERILAELGEGDLFGEMAIINSSPRNAKAIAKTDCGLYTVTRNNFQHQVEQLDPVMRGVFRTFVLTIRDFLSHRDTWLAAQNPEEESDKLTLYTPVKGAAINASHDAPSGGLASGQARNIDEF